MTNQEAKKAWANGKKLEYRYVYRGEGSWVKLTGNSTIGIFDDLSFQFRIVPEPVVLECVVEKSGGSKALYCDRKFVACCFCLGIDPPLGTRVKLTVEVE